MDSRLRGNDIWKKARGMRIFRETSWHGRVRGVTLVEMLVAVSITVMMLMVTGIVFKSSGEASGKAAALNEMMRQVRAITSQLESDLGGLRPDMPMAIMFEAHSVNNGPDKTLGDPDDSKRLVRYDRIAFFANGDFQTMDGLGSGNMARIFYGQAWDLPRQPADTIDPQRKILTRRRKIMTADNVNWPSVLPWPVYSPEEAARYDYFDMECASVSFWKNELYANFYVSYFDENQVVVSFVRRPNIAAVADIIGGDAVQKLYMLPDVTDFRIQLWFDETANPRYDGRWFPDDYNMPHLAFGQNFAFFWNVSNAPTSAPLINNFRWWSKESLENLSIVPFLPWLNAWPSAIKFTFTLYDKDRRHFPEGKTFTYVVNLPKRV